MTNFNNKDNLSANKAKKDKRIKRDIKETTNAVISFLELIKAAPLKSLDDIKDAEIIVYANTSNFLVIDTKNLTQKKDNYILPYNSLLKNFTYDSLHHSFKDVSDKTLDYHNDNLSSAMVKISQKDIERRKVYSLGICPDILNQNMIKYNPNTKIIN